MEMGNHTTMLLPVSMSQLLCPAGSVGGTLDALLEGASTSFMSMSMSKSEC